MAVEPSDALPSPSGAPIPLYYRLREALRARVAQGEVAVGSLFPTEQELCAQYGVSRTTVREAIQGLVQEGLLVRKQGKGTFVAAPKIEEELGMLVGFTERMEARGLRPSARTLSTEVVTVHGREAELLELPEGSKVYRIVRLRLANDEPMSVETGIFPYDIGLRVTQANLDEVGYYPLLEGHHGFHLSEADQTIEARQATAEEAGLLQLRRRATVVVMERRTTDTSGRRIELVRGAYRADRYRYRVHLRRPLRGQSPSRPTLQQGLEERS
ncbi:MAG TPA: GntR family transcriptional regulator [Chloroflexota bacterium]|jgi:GntR family transcriptional regulator